MKKVLGLLCACTLIFTGCEQAKTYQEGTYEATAVDTYGGQTNEASAKVTIDSEGKITSVYLDTTYTTSDGTKTTKKALKDDYGMKTGNSPYGSSEWEWYNQVEALEKAIVEKQGVDFLKLDDYGKTDTVSGCTIKVDALKEAVEKALKKAKN